MKKTTTTPSTRSITLNQSDLNRALNITGRALDTNRILPINEYYLFALAPNRLTIEACNMSVSIRTELTLLGNDLEFKIAIPGPKLRDYISKSKPEPIIFDFEENYVPEHQEEIKNEFSTEPQFRTIPEKISYSVRVKSSSNPKNNCSIPCELGEDFPIISVAPITEFQLPAESLISVFNKTMFAIGENQLVPKTCGLNISILNGVVTYTGTDMHAVIATYSFDVPDLPDADIIIPKKSLQLIQSLNPTGAIDIAIGKDAIVLAFNGIVFSARLIGEKYVDFKPVIPTGNEIEFVTSRPEMIQSLKRIMPFCDHGKLVKLNIGQSGLELIAENIDFNEEAKEQINGDLSGSPILVGANADYLMGILNSFITERIYFALNTNRTAIIVTDGVKHENPSKENLVLLMPIFV